MGAVLKKSKRFGPVKKIAENNETVAAVKMKQSFQEQQESLKQLEKLKGYRDDYVAQFKVKGQGGMSASRLREYQEFVQKLDHAIDEQIRAVQSMRDRVGEDRQAFKKTNSRKKVVEKLIEKSKQQELTEVGRQEQNEADDRVFKGVQLD
ncbi:MAG: flagellar export protein FliJ [Cycloclasticus sp.]|nr:flagellar export protein FliJ [Cycloclasticus sp.]